MIAHEVLKEEGLVPFLREWYTSTTDDRLTPSFQEGFIACLCFIHLIENGNPYEMLNVSYDLTDRLQEVIKRVKDGAA